MICGSGGWKSRLAKAACAEPAGQMRDEKLHAVVARSTFRSQNVQTTSASDHFWKLRCRKSARSCGAKHISKSKCYKAPQAFGPLLEVEMSKKCTQLWREAHIEVKMLQNTSGHRTTFGSWDVEKVHAVVARSTFPSQSAHWHTILGPLLEVEMSKTCTPLSRKHISKSQMLKTPGVTDHFWRFRCSKKCTPLWRGSTFRSQNVKKTGVRIYILEVQMSLRVAGARDCAPCQKWAKREGLVTFSTTLPQLHHITPHYAPIHYTTLQLQPHLPLHYYYTTLHYTTTATTQVHSITLHYITLHYITLRYTTLHYTSTTLHYITLHYAPQHYNYNYATTLHYTKLHSTTLNYTTLHYTTLHYTTLHYTTLHDTTLHPTTLQLQLHNYTPLHSTSLNYTTLHYITLHYTDLPLHFTTLHYTTLHWHYSYS